MMKIGDKGASEITVTEQHTAKAMGSGSLEVFATPALAALLEAASCDCISGQLEPGTTSVGTKMDLSHISATPVGMRVHSESILTAVEGKKLTFSVRAFDGSGLIGEGTHERVVVQTERFMAKARAKLE